MQVRAILLSSLVSVLLSLAGVKAPAPRVLEVFKEFDRISSRPLWPGFQPGRITLEVFDGGRTWLLRHPTPPAEFRPFPGEKDVAVFGGRHESLRANTSIVLGGIATATASFEGHQESPRRLACLLIHEAFHVFQARRHPKWGGNEVEQLLYPVDDPEVLAQRRLESTALTRALSAGNPSATLAWAARALSARRDRFARLPESASAYERGTEMKEGLARYVETRAAGQGEPLLPREEFPAQAVRLRSYASGCAIGLILDRLDPGWKRRLEKRDDVALDEQLRRVVAGSRPIEFSAADEEAARRRAADDVAALKARDAALRREFFRAPGWTVVIEAEDPLFPQGFDPWNVERLSASEVLHTRWIKLGNSSGSIEVLDRHCLTEGAGKRPLFEGIRRATITGLSSEPRIEETDGAVKISSGGLTLEFRGASVTRSGQILTVTLSRSPDRTITRSPDSSSRYNMLSIMAFSVGLGRIALATFAGSG